MRNILKKYWGYDSFRPLQEEIIYSVLSGNDTLGLMPTGGGKSITFQVPGMMLEGFTIVVSPLIALMKDQIDNLKARRIPAVYFHSGMTRKESNMAWEKIRNKKTKFIYIAPERLKNKTFIFEIFRLKVNLIVVDEAHCISQWGFDFRPAYLNIKELRKLFPDAPVLALTATAPPRVVKDICSQLEFREGYNVFRMSFKRDNINYLVRDSQSKLTDILHILSRTSGSSIIYVRSRKKTREISEYLNNAGIRATYYHAGLPPDMKETHQEQWMKGEARVVVATNAFGMGIDKPDVRVVIHYQMPPSLEEYYQEAGRAGRDGLTSYAVLLTENKDKGTLRRNLTIQFPEREVIKRIYTRICVFLHKAIGEGYNTIEEFNFEKFCETYRLNQATAMAAIKLLQQAGYIEYVDEFENSSRLIVTVTREDLYYEKISSPTSEKVLTAVLRRYPGLFTDYVPINEYLLSRDSGLPQETVYQSLVELSKGKIIHYIPRKRTPYIAFPTSMEEEKYIQIGKAIYEERMEILRQRIESMIDYAFSSETCRVGRMLHYFGEDNPDDCLKCDVCRSNNKRSDRKNVKNIRENILKMLTETAGGLTLPMIESEFGSRYEEAVEILRQLTDSDYLTLKDGVWELA